MKKVNCGLSRIAIGAGPVGAAPFEISFSKIDRPYAVFGPTFRIWLVVDERSQSGGRYSRSKSFSFPASGLICVDRVAFSG